MEEVKSSNYSSYGDYIPKKASELPERKPLDDLVYYDEHREWVTKDLYLAAAILALKYGKLERVDRSDPRHMKFFFSGTGLDEVQAAWTNKTLQVNAVEYANGIRQMKSIIHQND